MPSDRKPQQDEHVTVDLVIHLSPSLEKLLSDFLQTSLDQGAQTVADLSTITSAVEAQSGVVQSAVTLLESLANDLREAASDPAAVQALADQITAQSSELANAVAANDPNGPPMVNPEG